MEDITMAMTNRNNAKLDCMIYYTLDELVPQDHLVRKMERLKSTSLISIRKEEPTPVHTKAMQATVRFRQLFRVMFQIVPTL